MVNWDELSDDERAEQAITEFNIIEMLDYLIHKNNLHFRDKREYYERLNECIEFFIPRERISVKFIVDVEKYFAPKTE
jgi:hypothetical protein